jgi:adenylate kinase
LNAHYPVRRSWRGERYAGELHQRALSHSAHLDRRHVTHRGEGEHAVGRQGKKIMDAGGLVSDHIMLELVKARVAQPDCANGCLLDGFPRNVAQAEALTEVLKEQGVKIDYVVEIAVDDDEIIKRLSGRRVHPASGRVYHVSFNPPNAENKEDKTGEDLIQREDDREEIVREQLKVYHQQTEPLIQYYSKLAASGENYAPRYVRIEGTGRVEQIRDRIFAALG